MNDPPGAPAPVRRVPFLAGVVLAAAIGGCAAYTNLSFAVTNGAAFRFFPPFQAGVDRNRNRHLGAEYFNIARSLAAGDGFANPFGDRTGLTAWQPPLFPALLAGLLRACDGDRDAVMAVVVVLQVHVLIATGLLVLTLARRTTGRIGSWAAAAVFFLALVFDFKVCFQLTHDSWLVMLAVDLLVAGLCWCRPLGCWRAAAAWGLVGGFCAQVNPIVGLVWAIFSVLVGVRERAWPRLAVAVLAAGLVLTPWTVRNYLVFGRLIPVKSNLAYELYQSQCLQRDGLIQRTTFSHHPGGATTADGVEYRELGEVAFLDRKRQQFLQAVWADPLDYLDRVACRFLGATLWYESFDRPNDARNWPWAVRVARLTHPLPFLAFLVLMLTAVRARLHPAQWTVIGVYWLYLLPYIGASYYERYEMPILGVKVLLVIWAADRLLSLRPGTNRTGPTVVGVGTVGPVISRADSAGRSGPLRPARRGRGAGPAPAGC
jgi:hypothetical protein